MNIENIAEKVSNWTKSSNMLPKEAAEIEERVASGNSIFLIGEDGTPIGYAAITKEWPGNWMELGSVVIDPDERGKGNGHKMVGELFKKAKEKFPNSNLFALCNKFSLKLFTDNGAVIMTDSSVLPEEVWEDCIKCSSFQAVKAAGKICCDTPVKI